MVKSVHATPRSGGVVLAVDLGTSWCKAGCYDRRGRLLAHARADSRTRPLSMAASQADLNRWWHAVTAAVRALPRGTPPEAFSLSCRGFFGVFLDGRMRSAVPRGAPQIPRDLSAFASAGWEPGGLWAPAYGPIVVANARWLREHHPAIHARIRRAGALHNYIVWRLTGRWVTDPASGPGGAVWPRPAMSRSGLARVCFPDPLPSEAIAGRLSPAAARSLDLPPGIPVAVGGHDGAIANLGGGVFRPGGAMLTLGTNVVLRVVTGRPVRGWFGYPIPPGAWAWVRSVPGLAPRVEVARRRGGRAYARAADEVGEAARHLLLLAAGAGLRPRRLVATGGLSRFPGVRRRLRAVLGSDIEWTDPEAGLRGAAMLAAVAAGWCAGVPAAARAMRFGRGRTGA